MNCIRTMIPALGCLAALGVSAQEDPVAGSDQLAGAWPARVALEERGIAPFAALTTEGWVNTVGGLHRGAWWNSLLEFGVELDTGKLGWWDNGGFMMEGHWVENLRSHDSLEGLTGAFNPASGIMAAEHFRVFNLFYRHCFGEDRVVIKVGQIAADDDFMLSDYAALFLNSAFGAMPSQVGTPLGSSSAGSPAFPVYPVAAPGILVQVRPREGFYTQLGAYYGKPGMDERDNFGFDWASQSPAELSLFWENGFSYQLGEHPAALRLGLSYHTGSMDEFVHDPAIQITETDQRVPDVYGIHDLALVQTEEGQTRLGLFVRGGFTPDTDHHVVTAYADGGLNWFGPITARPDDVAGVAVSHTVFGRNFRHSSRPDDPASGETTWEITYRAQVTPWLAVQGDVQVLFNPAREPGSGDRKTALLTGIRGDVSF